MNEHWFMVTLVGRDRPGIVARVAKALFEGGCNLGEASMLRLGESFTIMLMVRHTGPASGLHHLLQPAADALGLRVHVDPIQGTLHRHLQPDVRIRVSGADRPGIVAQVTGAMAEAGLNIIGLESDVAGTEDRPIYIMCIEGQALNGIAPLEAALDTILGQGIEAHLEPIDTLIG